MAFPFPRMKMLGNSSPHLRLLQLAISKCAFESSQLHFRLCRNLRFTIVQHSEKEADVSASAGTAGAATAGELENGNSVSRFHVAPILDQDGGEISCEVANRFGRDSKTFLLSIEGKYIYEAEWRNCIRKLE
jgi:hypothetical protein